MAVPEPSWAFTAALTHARERALLGRLVLPARRFLVPYVEATFLVDPPTFILVGVAIALFFRWKRLPIATVARRRAYALLGMTAFMAWFIGTQEVPCYFDRMEPPPFSEAQTCNEFMWHGYVDWPFGNPPIPSYRESWSTPWILANWALQVLIGLWIVAAMFRERRSERERDDFPTE
jgi:hypothetical protein